jgi:chemotaxis protein MotB
MARRRLEEEHVNHERWLVSYADFITLLFAFFVVMYSISQVNESKYRVLSNTLTSAFRQPDLKVDSLPLGEVVTGNPDTLIELEAIAVPEPAKAPVEGEVPDELRRISEQVEQQLRTLVEQQLISMRGNEDWLEISLASSLLFDSGDATLSLAAMPVLGEIATILRDQPNPVRIEGFTDNVPISTPRFPSNWELSSARAVSVLQFLVEEGLSPQRLVALGYGEFQPAADNTSAEGRARNRRVVLMISRSGALRPTLAPLRDPGPSAPAP